MLLGMSKQKPDQKFFEYKDSADFAKICTDQLHYFQKHNIFARSIKSFSDGTKKTKKYVFYEGPPSANGMPGIHHMMARTLKDVFCRYKSLCGYVVERNAGWDAHGLPIELSVEKELRISKEDIDKTISIKDFNFHCKNAVTRYQSQWESFTNKMGYWVDLDNPYITCDAKYIESLWWIISEINKLGLLYKDFSIQPYSPMAGTALSSHELNQPGCYKSVNDLSVVCQFKIIKCNIKLRSMVCQNDDIYLLAWTTTPWTLPANTALCVGKKIQYVLVKTINKYSFKEIYVILAKKCLSRYFKNQIKNIDGQKLKLTDSSYELLFEFSASLLLDIKYEPVFDLLPEDKKPDLSKAFAVVDDDFVTTTDGTGIVHMAACYGADDARICKKRAIPAIDIVSYTGQYYDYVKNYGLRYIKQSYLSHRNLDITENSLDVDLSVDLKKRNLAFRIAKYEHNYPHCWRTDTEILYLPVDSWFIKTTAVKQKLIDNNNKINWFPAATGKHRFGDWLANLVDWNISRSRYWGTPLPIWVSKNRKHKLVISSLDQLKKEIAKSIALGFMDSNFLEDYDASFANDSSKDVYYKDLDLHRTNLDKVVLSKNSTALYRENDVIDVWFDSGAMPYACVHYPFKNQQTHDFPADFIAEGVDQTRGWFFSLHVLGTILKDQIAYKNVLSGGLVLGKDGQKMSKRLGNTVNPDEIMDKYGADVLRFYMLSQSKPWDNMKFDLDELKTSTMKFFATVFHAYHFFAIYANLDNYQVPEIDKKYDLLKALIECYASDKSVSLAKNNNSDNTNANNNIKSTQLIVDKWILSELSKLVKDLKSSLDKFDPCSACRMLQHFVCELLSNWYVRLNRKRFWQSQFNSDKILAYHTLWQCLYTLSKLMACFVPMIADRLFLDLKKSQDNEFFDSVHLNSFPKNIDVLYDAKLNQAMNFVRLMANQILSLREQAKIKVRQPLSKAYWVSGKTFFELYLDDLIDLVKTECNIKSIEKFDLSDGKLKRIIKPNYKSLGARLGKYMKAMASYIKNDLCVDHADKIDEFCDGKCFINVPLELLVKSSNTSTITTSCEMFKITVDDVLVSYDHHKDLLVSYNDGITVAVDTNLTESLISEGLSREFVNRVQNLRKEAGFDISDKILIDIYPLAKSACENTKGTFEASDEDGNNTDDGNNYTIKTFSSVLKTHRDYILSQILCNNINIHSKLVDQKESPTITDDIKLADKNNDKDNDKDKKSTFLEFSGLAMFIVLSRIS